MRTPLPIAERFWRLALLGEGCWRWKGNHNQAGYGQFRVGRKGPVMSAHRVSWAIHNGPIPASLIIMHSCDNPWCVNPAHLSVGTQKDNMADCLAKGRRAKRYGPHTRVRKLTDDQVRSIRADPRTGWVVAAEHRVSETTVYAVRAGKRKAPVA